MCVPAVSLSHSQVVTAHSCAAGLHSLRVSIQHLPHTCALVDHTQAVYPQNQQSAILGGNCSFQTIWFHSLPFFVKAHQCFLTSSLLAQLVASTQLSKAGAAPRPEGQFSLYQPPPWLLPGWLHCAELQQALWQQSGGNSLLILSENPCQGDTTY